MATKFDYKNRHGEIKQGTAYSMKEKNAYHSMRAKTGSINPKTNKPFSDVARARSRGWLSARKEQSELFKLQNPHYQKKK